MTVRTAELLMAIFLSLASIALMWKSTDGLSIGWVRGAGPGSGAWPFWLSAIMLLSCLAVLVRWFMRATPQSVSKEIFMSAATVQIVGITVAALVLLLLGAHYIGIYISLFLFLFFYMFVLGKHSLVTSIVLTLAIPVFIFFFFEYLLVIPLPKGVSEPLFYPIYDLIY